ncbi:hypothetical protein MKEN_00865800 [Mycena kentingensis (nom. inval.)]|nr:hypothetical protein MKEN_00865800 [Mycena kentingensis (nom. inval.)]
MPATRSSKKKAAAKGKKKAVEEPVEEVVEQVAEEVPEPEPAPASVPEPEPAADEDVPMEEEPSVPEPETPTSAAVAGPSLTMEERKAKLEELKKRRAASHKANRVSLVEESARASVSAREAARLEKQRKLAEMLRTKADAEERGDPDAVERAKNWEWTIEENDNWEKKKARKARRADFQFHDDADAARKRYKKDLDLIKPDLVEYNRQKELAMGLAPGALTGFNSNDQMVPTAAEQQQAAENLYRDANTLIYGDNKPSEEQIDRVVSKLARDKEKKAKFSRKRANEQDDGIVDYINSSNKVFNKKIARYYDKYTHEIKASFERGTAL